MLLDEMNQEAISHQAASGCEKAGPMLNGVGYGFNSKEEQLT
jgi:hypothetical protein